MPLPPGTRLGRYEVRSPLGAGGMGEVYLARDTTELEREVAVKVLPADLATDPERMRRFVQEAKTASSLNHPNIITVHEIGQEDGTRYLVTEFVEGETLRRKMTRERLSLREALDIAAQIASALVAAHKAGVVHRDIKPENVMVRGDGIVKVLDFGLAKPTGRPTGQTSADSEASTRALVNTSPGMIMGTVSYMSPEQARGLSVDERTDIWSLGVVLYEMAAGRLPFAGDTTSDVLAHVLTKEPPALTITTEKASERLDEIVQKALTKDREERCQHVRDLLIDLKRLKQRLDVEAEIERTQTPEERAAATTESGRAAVETVGAPAARTAGLSVAHQTSSAEYIVTEVKRHKRGVLLVLAALTVATVAVAYFAYSRYSSGGGGGVRSVAVLPFQNAGGDPEMEYLSDGLAESLIYRLSQLPNLKVSPTSSVFRYKGKETDMRKIGNELGVQAVMTGRIVQRGDSLTISVELVDALNNKLLWGEKYERRMSELLATQREIAAEITDKLRLKLSGEVEQKLAKKYTDNNEAYQLYLKGRFYWNKRDEGNLRKAIEQFKAAADKDPNFALAYVGLADCYILLPYYSSGTSTEVLPPAKAYAERALEIDDSLGEAHTSLGYVNRLLWNWAEAEKELKRGIELNPNYATAHKFYGNLLNDLGLIDESVAEYKRAQELEPLSLIISINLAEVYLQKGDLNAAVEQCQRAIELDPNWYYARLQLSLAYLKQGRDAEAVAEAEKSVELSKRQSSSLGVLGYVYAQTGRRGEAATVVEDLKGRYVQRQANGYDIARVYVGLVEKDQAFAWLEKDFESRNATMPSFLYMPPLDSLRDDPRFKDLARRIGLPELK